MEAIRTWRLLRGRFSWPLMLLVLVLLMLGVAGCNTSLFSGSRAAPGTERFLATVRPASGDTERLLRNAHYFRLMGRPEMALKELEEAHQQDPNNLKLLDQLAQGYEEQGDFARAQKLYQEALARVGNHAALHNNLCFSYYQAGQWDQAEACYREALTRNPQNQAARNNLGLLLCRLGKLDQAQQLWQTVEGEAGARQRIGETLAALGMREPANYAQSPRSSPPVASAPREVAPPPATMNQTAAKPQEAAPVTPTAPAVTASTPVTPANTGSASPPPAPAPRATAPAPVAAAPLSEPRVAPAPAAAPTEPRPQATPPIQPAIKAKALPVVAPTAAAPQTRPAPAPPSQAPSVTPAPSPQDRREAPLTTAELTGTDIALLNGAGSQDLARQLRALLWQQGFQVASIGNHLDFGAEKTLIYYRPEAERVARALCRNFFPDAQLEPSTRIRGGADVKVILGRDLLNRVQLLDQLAALNN